MFCVRAGHAPGQDSLFTLAPQTVAYVATGPSSNSTISSAALAVYAKTKV